MKIKTVMTNLKIYRMGKSKNHNSKYWETCQGTGSLISDDEKKNGMMASCKT